MPTVKKLPARLKKLVHDLAQLREALARFDEHLALAHAATEDCAALSREERAPVSEHLDAAHNHLAGLLAAQGVSALAQAREHFGRQGIVVGATIELSYPDYGARPDAADFDDARVPRRLRSAVLRVEGFTVEHVRSRTEVILGVQGRPVVDGRPVADKAAAAASFPLHPGCAFTVLQRAPEAPRQPAAADAAAGATEDS